MSGEHTHDNLVSMTTWQGVVERIEHLSRRIIALENRTNPTPAPEPELPTDVFVRTYPDSGNDKDRDKYEYQQAHDHGLQFVPAPFKPGRGAVQVLLRANDVREPATDGFRAEFTGEPRWGEGDEVTYAIAIFIPDDWNQGNNSTWNDRIIFQFTDQGSPMFSLHMRDQFVLRRKDPDGRFSYHASVNIVADRWYNFTFHVKWTRNGDGFFKTYLDGNFVNEYRGRTLAVRSTTYAKWGIYGQPTKLYYGEVRWAKGARVPELTTDW